MVTRGVAVFAAVAIFALAGCGSSQEDSDAVVPGGAVAVVPDGVPDFCAAMTQSEALTDLDNTFAALAEPSAVAGAREDLRGAAASLVDVAPAKRPHPHLRHEFLLTARALRLLAAHPRDGGTANRVAISFRSLGKQLQGVCRFPRG
jgi:hypothetical protein